MVYKQTANFVKYTETDVASLIEKAGWNIPEIGANFLPHVERLPTGDINLHLVHKGLAEKIGGPDYTEKLESNPGYIWGKLRENQQMAGVVNDKRIARKKLPIRMIVDAEVAAVCNAIIPSPRIKKVPFDSVSKLGYYRDDDPCSSSHFQEHAMEKKLEEI